MDFEQVLKSKSIKNDFKLLPGDEIIIPEHPMVVQLSGGIQIPGLLKFRPGKKAGYYINSAGGFQRNADRGSTIIVRANGNVSKASRRFWWDPVVNEGDHIRIDIKEKGEPFNVTTFLKESASIMASLATVIFIISQTSK